MNTENRQVEEQPVTPIDYKDRYEAAIGRSEHKELSQQCSELVIARLMSIKPNTQATLLTKQIEAFAAKGDVDKILELSLELRQYKDEESGRLERLATMRSEYSFEDLLSAFPEELQSLAYELAFDVLECTERGLKAPVAKRPTRLRTKPAKKSYVIAKGDQSITVVANTGRPKSPGEERDFYAFVGFEVSEDGKSLSPASFTSKAGERIEGAKISKRSIIEDLLAKNAYWLDMGLSITEVAEVTETKSDAPAAQAPQSVTGTEASENRDERHAVAS
jgi:hypothetical protein